RQRLVVMVQAPLRRERLVEDAARPRPDVEAIEAARVPGDRRRPVGDEVTEEVVAPRARPSSDGRRNPGGLRGVLRHTYASARDAVVCGRHTDLASVGRIARVRYEIDDAGERARTIENGARTADDLDALHILDVGAEVVADVRRPEPVVIERMPV